MKPETLIEVIEAGHLTSFVQSEFPQRGGIMLIGPPGVLKTTFIESAVYGYPSALVLSDLNINSLMKLRESLISGRFSTVAFPEFEKLYARKAETASNVEATIKQLVEEGFTNASFEDQDAITTKVKAFILGAMTHSFYKTKVSIWRESGFKRRFLWVGIRLGDPDRIMKAIRHNKKIELGGIWRRHPTGSIPFHLTQKECKEIEKHMASQWEATPYALIQKIFAVLKWKYEDQPGKAMAIISDFAASIKNELADVELPEYVDKYRGSSEGM